METELLTSDDELIARLQAPPPLCDGVESLAYWRGRRRRLPWYRARARREASRMILAWERRVRAALLAERSASFGARVQAVRLVATGPAWRWVKRGAFVLATATLVVLVSTVLAMELVVRSL